MIDKKQVKDGGEGSRVEDLVQNGRERVSTRVSEKGAVIRTEEFADGTKVTDVEHPPKMLKQPGQLKRALESGVIDLAVFQTRVLEGLDATKPVILRDKGMAFVEQVPDFQTRLTYLQFITETVEGMPVKRQEIITKKLTTKDDLIAQAKKSPAFARGLLEVLQQVVDNGDGRSVKGAAWAVPRETDKQ